MNTWYEIGNHYGETIEPVRVIKETPAQITILRPSLFDGPGRQVKTAKHSSYHSYYPSFAEAKKALQARITDQITRHEVALASEHEKLTKVNNLLEVQ